MKLVDSDTLPAAEATSMANGSYLFGDFRFDLDQRTLFYDDEALSLSPKAFNLLEVLIRHVDQVVPAQSLRDEVWAAVRVEDSVLKVRIAEIRAALDETAAAPRHIHTHQRVGYRFAGPVRFLPTSASATPQVVVAFSQRPALAILPFDDFSGGPGDEFFADGIVEELTTRLARFRYFPVIARNSSFVYKGQAIDVAKVSRELGARYVVEGSVQRSEDRARIIVQLIDGETMHHVWTDRFESSVTDIFDLNDEMTDRIAGAMHSQLYAQEIRRAIQFAPRNLDSWYCLLRGWSLQESMDPAENASAETEFLRALELDSGCAQACSGLAMSKFREVIHGWSTSPLDAIRDTRHYAELSLKLDPQDPYSHLACAVSHWLHGKRDDLLDSIEHAIWLNPSLAWGHLWGGIAYGVAGEPERSLEMATRAIALSPLDPLRGIFDYALAIAHFAAGRFEPAFHAAHQAVRLMPTWGWPYSLMASSAAFLERPEEAEWARRRAQELLPGLTSENFADLLPFASSDFLERSIQGAKRAGWQD